MTSVSLSIVEPYILLRKWCIDKDTSTSPNNDFLGSVHAVQFLANPPLRPPRPKRTLGGTNLRDDKSDVRDSITSSIGVSTGSRDDEACPLGKFGAGGEVSVPTFGSAFETWQETWSPSMGPLLDCSSMLTTG